MKIKDLKRIIREELKTIKEQRPSVSPVGSGPKPMSPPNTSPEGSGPNSGRPNVSPVGGGGEPMNPTVLAQMMDRGMGPGTEVEPRIIFLFRWACQLMGYDGYQPSSAGGSEVGYNGRCI